ncbi:MAG: hypothetical protein ACLFSQ_05270 [Candidatus Zixiibacteriota bacterium]
MVIGDFRRSWESSDISNSEIKLEYGPLDIAWKLARYEGSGISKPVFYAQSGYSTTFLYNKDKFWVYDNLRDEFVRNALTRAGLKIKIVLPNNFEDAIELVKENIEHARLVYASWYEPFLIYGFEDNQENPTIHWHNRAFADKGQTWDKEDFYQNWWNWTEIPEAKNLVIVEGKTEPPDLRLLTIEIVKDFVDNMRLTGNTKEPDGTYSGLRAYHAYYEDLKNESVKMNVFERDSGINRIAWFDFAIYSQWTQTYALKCLFEEAKSRFDKKKADELENAANELNEAYKQWHNWEGKIGRLDDEDLFLRRIGNIQIRRYAAENVLEARSRLEKALDYSEKFLGLIQKEGGKSE